MRLKPFIYLAAGLVLLCAGAPIRPEQASAQVFDFSQIDAFESMGTGTQNGGSAAKTIVDDGDQHTVIFSILESNADAKIYWRSMDGDQTMLIHGPSVKAFQIAGRFKIEALGDESRSFKYGYILFRLKNNRGT
jgi:hypothetical protein